MRSGKSSIFEPRPNLLSLLNWRDRMMENSDLLMDVLPAALAVIIGIGGMLMMLTTVFTEKR